MTMGSGDSSIEFGKRVKALRTDRKLRIADVAKASGLAISTISKVENGQMSLTYDKLLQLAAGLGVGMPQLFVVQGADGEWPENVASDKVLGRRAISRRDEGKYIETRQYEYLYVCPDFSRKLMTPLLGRTTARTLEEFGPMVRHPGQEYIFVLDGAMEVHSEFYQPVHLAEGESMYFDSMMGHAYLTASDAPCRFLLVCSKPSIHEGIDED
jgi:transcriptional regulator with XRE-family HTH domain